MPRHQQASRTSHRTKHNQSTPNHNRSGYTHQNGHHSDDFDELTNQYIPPADPSEPPDYDYSRDRGRKIRLRKEEQCVFNHSRAENSPLLDVKQWREKLKILRALPKPKANEKEIIKRPRHKPHKGKKPKEKKNDGDPEKSLKISANIPSTAIDYQVEDSDMVAFGDILDPKMSADTRYDKYLEELGRDDGVDKADLESLYKAHHAHAHNGDVRGETANDTPYTENEVYAESDDDVNVAVLVAKAPTKKQIPVRSFSTDPVINVSGTHGTLHEKPQTESRLSLNNFKLRLHLSDNDHKETEQNKHASDEINSSRKCYTVMDSARVVSQDVKLINYVTKPAFSPRRMSYVRQNSDKADAALRRESLHLPESTTKNFKTRTPVPATKTVIPEVKGGGWKVTHSKRELDFRKMIPVSVTGDTSNKSIVSDMWKYKT